MDFYKYIHSKDVAEHLKKTNFHLNSLQCLWIVYQNNDITLNEKTEALEYILTMPDYEFANSDGKSVHTFIKEYFDYLELIKQELTEKDDNSFYTGFIKYEEHTSHLAIYFKDYESCLNHIKENIIDTKRVVKGYKIHKIPFNTYDDTIMAEYVDGELISIHKCSEWNPLSAFFWMAEDYVKLPTPFKPGDILYDLIEEKIVVLESVSPNDMGAICYYVSDDGKTLEKDYVLFFTNLKYYTEELTGKDIALYAVSDFIKKQQWFRL